jgi:prolyl 4-hydroxylase
VIIAIRARIVAAAATPPDRLESPQVLHYAPGEAFGRHHDFFDPKVAGFAPMLARHGQRVATFLIYLNGDFEGGETEFPRLSLTYKGQPGDALMFVNVDAAGAPDHRTLHAGLPPRSGEKWLFSQWIRDRRAI